MYKTHFLKNDATTLNEEAQHIITQTVEETYRVVHEELNLKECEVLVAVNAKRVSNNEMFFGLSYDETAMYLFADADAIHSTLLKNKEKIAKNITEHCCRGLYTTARTQHIGLDAHCGLLEEVINEGLAEIFVTEKLSVQPKSHCTQFSKEEVKRLWEKIKNEHNATTPPNIEKWFWGSEEESIPPLTACAIGYAIANAYLAPYKKKSCEALTVPAKHIAKSQNSY